jgi:hypothetical protein
MSNSHMTSNDDSTAAGPRVRLARRLMRSASVLAVTAVQRWAWSTLAVPIALTVVAVVAYLLHRSGRSYPRLGAALDSLLVTASTVLDADTPAPRTPLRRAQHALIRRLTSGAVARRRGAAIPNNSPAAPETGPASPAS